MSNELKNLPTLSYDLIEWLDRNMALPRHLQPGEDVDFHLHSSGARALIDQLVQARDQETSPDDVSPDDGTSMLEISEDGTLPSVLGTGRVLGPSSPSFQLDIGEPS